MKFVPLLLVICFAIQVISLKEMKENEQLVNLRKFIDMNWLQFEQWMHKYNKSYKFAEKKTRFMNFKNSLVIQYQAVNFLKERISILNQNHTHSTFGLNKFSDLSQQEFRAKFGPPVI